MVISALKVFCCWMKYTVIIIKHTWKTCEIPSRKSKAASCLSPLVKSNTMPSNPGGMNTASQRRYFHYLRPSATQLYPVREPGSIICGTWTKWTIPHYLAVSNTREPLGDQRVIFVTLLTQLSTVLI